MQNQDLDTQFTTAFQLDELQAFLSMYQPQDNGMSPNQLLDDTMAPSAVVATPAVDFVELAAAAAGLEDWGSPSMSPASTSNCVASPSSSVASPSNSVASPSSSVASPETVTMHSSDSVTSSSTLFPVVVTYGVSTEDLPRVLEEEVLAPRSSAGPKRTRRRRTPVKEKLYERAAPFADEAAERRRLNAVNAKRHRDLNKAKFEAIEEEVKTLREENQRLKDQLKALMQEKPLAGDSNPFGNQGWTFFDDFGGV